MYIDAKYITYGNIKVNGLARYFSSLLNLAYDRILLSKMRIRDLSRGGSESRVA
jgi:hypothetical protein